MSRHNDSADGRVRWVGLTDEGLAAINTLIPQHLKLEAELLSGIDPERRERLAEDLRVLLLSLELVRHSRPATPA